VSHRFQRLPVLPEHRHRRDFVGIRVRRLQFDRGPTLGRRLISSSVNPCWTVCHAFSDTRASITRLAFL
jgi:hypothetical protein